MDELKCSCHTHENEENENSKVNFIFTIFGVFICVIAFIIQDIYDTSALLLYLAGYICIGYDIVIKALKKLFKKDMFDENFLMFIATVGAFFIGEYIEAIAVILLYKIGEFLQDMAIDNSKKKISSVLNMKAEYANLFKDGNIIKVEPESLKIGNIIVVKNGEKIPVDGRIVEGNTYIDMSSLTGESTPVNKLQGDEILSGTINVGNAIKVEVINTLNDSTVSKIIELIENATEKKSNTENFITKFSKVYTPIVTIVAVVIAFLPLFFDITFNESLHRAFTFLVISCPCALVISVPLSFFIGIGVSSKHGILVKGSNYLDALNNVTKVVFDKTGTLTQGYFSIEQIVSIEEKYSQDNILKFIVACEKLSNHYIAKSIINSYNKAVDIEVQNHKEIAGYGIEASINSLNVLVGNLQLLKNNDVDIDKLKDVDNIRGTIVYLAIDKKCVGYIILADSLKDGANELVKNLKKLGVKECVMLTGDNKNIAELVSKELNFDKVYAELLPQDKVKIIEELKFKQNSNEKIAYIGDGINDSPALSLADVGISMGKGTDIAIETSDIVLMSEEINKIDKGINIARKTRKIVIQNIVFALTIKILFLILSGIGMMTMIFAIFADVGVALITILNALRIFKIK